MQRSVCLQACCKRLRSIIWDQGGQGTVEAAFVLPVLMLCLLLLLQPAIILYDRMVMEAAAQDGCRALATSCSGDVELCKDYVIRRLGAIPPQDLFHVHSPSCSWKVEVAGGQETETVGVKLSNEIKPLPLLGQCMQALGLLNDQGYYVISVEATNATQPSWVTADQLSEGPSSWIGAWCDD